MLKLDFYASVVDRHRRFDLQIKADTDAAFIALYGPSGGGKSLTLQALAGLLPVDKGLISLGGLCFHDSERRIHLPAQRRQIGYLFQNYALFPHLTVRQNIAFGLTNSFSMLSPAQIKTVDTLIDQFSLKGMERSRPADLSGGQQQRVALARALACNPRVLLLDEPFAALNPMLRAQMRAELKLTQHRHGIPIVMVTHDQADVLALADVAILIDTGQVQQEIDLRTHHGREYLIHHQHVAY